MHPSNTSQISSSDGIVNQRTPNLDLVLLLLFFPIQDHFALIFSIPSLDAPDEFSVKTKDGDFSISHYPLEQSKFLFDMMEGKKKFGDAINKVFDYTMFRYRNGLEFLYFKV